MNDGPLESLGKPLEQDYWHVDLWGWALPKKPYRSRSLYGRNLPDNTISGDERNFDSGVFGSGLELNNIIETLWWNQIALTQEVVDRAWMKPKTLVNQGFIAPPMTGP